MNGRIYKRGGTYWLDYGWRGDRHRESSGSSRKGDANALLRKRLAEMGKGGPMVNEERVTLDSLLVALEDEYVVNGRKSLKRLHTSAIHLRAGFPKARAVDVTTDTVRRYTRKRQAAGAANASIQKELAALKRAFRLAQLGGTLTRVPAIEMPRLDNTRRGFLDRPHLDAILATATPHIQGPVLFAFLTGWRKGEILPLRWEQVDWDAGEVRLEPGTTKNGEGRTFPFQCLPELETLMRAQHDARLQAGHLVPWVFHRDGKQLKEIRGAWTGACGRAGLEGALFHDLRRSAVRNLERAGVSRSVAMKLTGHKTESVYRRYAIVDATALSEGVEKLARHKNGTNPRLAPHILPFVREA